MLRWFDTHIHLFAPEWDDAPDVIYRRARSAGVAGFLMPGVRVAEWRTLLSLAWQLPGVYLAPGLHPAYADQWTPEAADLLRSLTDDAKVVAIGEIGLDAVVGPAWDIQEKAFRQQLAIAVEAGLPVLIHCRKATGRVIEILRELRIGKMVGGIWHGFSGSVQSAHGLVDLGFKIGVGSILLRETARKLPQAVLELPDAALVLETDAPDMIESPGGLIQVAERLAELKGWTLGQTARVAGRNAEDVLGVADEGGY